MSRISLTQQAQALIRLHVVAADTVIDATAGNGHDTVLLAEQVGEFGRVFAFDNQDSAIESTRSRLMQAGLTHRVELISQGHQHMLECLPDLCHENVKAVMFNLGYRPNGNKLHTTVEDSSLSALEQAFTLLCSGGLLSIIAYTGHPGGRMEADAIKQWAATLTQARFDITIPASKNNNAPEWLVVYKD